MIERIIALIARYLDVPTEDIKSETLIRDIINDSLDFIEIIILIEEEFQIDIPEDTIDTLITVSDVDTYILSMVNRKVKQ